VVVKCLRRTEIIAFTAILVKLFVSLEQNNQLDATINHKIYCFVVQILLNMFRALQCPSSGARQTAVAASGFRVNVEVEVFSAVAENTSTSTFTSKPEAATAV
jgi:hypothetical protein